MQKEIICSGEALKRAVDQAFSEIEKDGTNGFEYPIGLIKGRPISLSWSGENNCSATRFKEGTTQTAIFEWEGDITAVGRAILLFSEVERLCTVLLKKHLSKSDPEYTQVKETCTAVRDISKLVTRWASITGGD